MQPDTSELIEALSTQDATPVTIKALWRNTDLGAFPDFKKKHPGPVGGGYVGDPCGAEIREHFLRGFQNAALILDLAKTTQYETIYIKLKALPPRMEDGEWRVVFRVDAPPLVSTSSMMIAPDP